MAPSPKGGIAPILMGIGLPDAADPNPGPKCCRRHWFSQKTSLARPSRFEVSATRPSDFAHFSLPQGWPHGRTQLERLKAPALQSRFHSTALSLAVYPYACLPHSPRRNQHAQDQLPKSGVSNPNYPNPPRAEQLFVVGGAATLQGQDQVVHLRGRPGRALKLPRRKRAPRIPRALAGRFGAGGPSPIRRGPCSGPRA